MENGESPPFWQPPTTITRRQGRPSSCPILHSSLVIILLPSITLLLFVFIVIPSIPKFVILPQNYHITPNSPLNSDPKPVIIKKSWQHVNVVLVVVAILCGVFARRNDDVSTPHNQQQEQSAQRSKSGGDQTNAGPQQWYGYHEQRIYSPVMTPVTGISRLRRTVSELPPSQSSDWETGNDKLRFFDDFDVSKFYQVNQTRVDDVIHQYDDVIPAVKEIPVDTFVLETRDELPSPIITPPSTPPMRSPAPPPPPPPPPLPPLPRTSNKKPKRTFNSLPRRETAPPPPPPPPPPSLPSPARGEWGEKKKRSSRKRMKATMEIANAIVSLYNNRNRKRKLKSESPATVTDVRTPPPPPPPPPASVFHGLFKKGSKRKKIHSLSSIPTPPPPPPRRNTVRKPPLPTNSGNQSPMIPPPPSPPAPPFKVAEMKFVMRGGFIHVQSAQSSRYGSPDLDEERETHGGPTMTSPSPSVTCPSPDVNSKADTFIARLHDGWRLEKLNSWREKHYNGPDLGPGHTV